MLLMLASCGPQYIGYGVLLWSPDETVVSSGALTPVVSDSEISNSYVLEIGDETLEVEKFRVAFYEDEATAVEAAAAYAPLAPLYGRSLINALPMRSARTTEQDNRVYRLKEGELVKIVDRDEEPTNIHGLVGRWYEALTAEGTRGYVFGHSLQVYNPVTDEPDNEDDATDPYIDLLLGGVWRPESFSRMVTTGHYDLREFSPRYGLFPRPEEQELELVMPSYSTTFAYTEIANVGTRRYLAAGTSLQLQFRTDGRLSAQFIIDDQQYSLALIRFEQEIDEYIHQELERRAEIYQTLYDAGPTLASNSYGTITLDQSGSFTWEEFDALVPNAIPARARSTGRIELNHYLDAGIAGEYSGVLTFVFSGISVDESPHFVYTLNDEGLRLVYAPPATIEENAVTRISTTPIVAFFSGQE